MYSRRTNLGPVREDVHAGWDLASHDVSIFLYLKGEVPVERPVKPNDVLATMYRHLGIDPTRQLITREGRPISLLPDGEVIGELV